ncbi:hypothetical protein GCM10011452_10300 [Gemmobacter lanyuensis]|uniref:Type I restriction modification DNA specificity domain-containing protein n=1 Tax=Gemmobacter lanyuensis TaxID=1054497 RepID=A0A918IPR9_9RHOB|nr:N-6 DNA methylase [Gemmobacter lanyuensis]GGW24839.1 hypothetical protein GCM10011452_10300 [Gemmobacter lanyuensis]
MNILDIIKLARGSMRSGDAYEAVIEIAANMVGEELSFDQLRCAARVSTKELRTLLETAAEALLRAEREVRFGMILQIFDQLAADGGGSEFWASRDICGQIVRLAGDVNSVRFTFPAAFRACLTYAFRMSAQGRKVRIHYAGCIGLEHIFYDVLGILDIQNCSADERMPWDDLDGEQYELEVMLPMLGAPVRNAEELPSNLYAQMRLMPSRASRLNYETLAIAHALARAESKAMIFVSEGELFRMVGAEAATRQNLVESGRLRGVISIPAGMLHDSTMVRFGLLVLAKDGEFTESVRFVDMGHPDLSRPSTRGRFTMHKDAPIEAVFNGPLTHDKHLSWDIATREIVENNYVLTPARYLNTGPKEQIDALLRNSEAVELPDLVEMIRPINLQKSEEAEYTIFEASPGDVGVRGYLDKPGRAIEVDRATYSRAVNQQLKPGDVLLSIKGTIGVVGIVPNTVPGFGEREIWTAGQSLMILRGKKRASIDPIVLYEYLSDDTVQAFIKSMAGGTVIPNLGMKDLKSFQVPIPSADVMAEVRARFMERQTVFDEIERLQKRVASIRAAHWPHAELAQAD